MRRTIRAWGWTVVVLAASALGGCGVTLPEEEEPTLLRTYQVPVGQQEELRRMLQNSLEFGGNALGRVEAGPGGTLLVVAPQSIHRGIAEVLDGDFPAPTPAVPVTIDYWLMLGRPLEGGTGGTFTLESGRPAPQLDAVMREIAAAQGPTEFALLEQVRLTALVQESAEATGAAVQIEQTVTRAGEALVAYIQIGGVGSQNRLRTRIALERDQFAVLGQVGYVPSYGDPRARDARTLYYVIRAGF